MNLHKDKTAFSTMLTTFSERANIRADILEKDYYVRLKRPHLQSVSLMKQRRYFTNTM